ncbi:phenylacetic acid degradation protein PaaY [Roseospirillum parvum]|uniref:Phenylacetic acid degradation protein n=1 Tax=Roseospirillum parvum TaxID=83401 RepID=A0A1G8E893_9PROT|nr:phenylacetic acid degradation protein PaaY [Roseospirillum parvum]SDH66168.1 phenylacetic acid degradation protein [Roseospirillum parvum]
MPTYEIEGVRPVIDPTAFVHPDAVLIGDVIIGPGCYVAPACSLRGDFGRLILKAGSNIQDNCTMHGFPGTDTVIEEDGHVGHGAVLHGCVVGRNALVGMNATVMDGAVIGPECIVAAASFIKAGWQIPARSLVAGVPGRIVRQVSDEELAWKEEGTREYQTLTRRSLASLKPCAPLSEVDAERQERRVEAGDAEPLFARKSQGGKD